MRDQRVKLGDFPGNLIIMDKSLAVKATETIRDMIIKGECPMGARLMETDFAEAMGVSRAIIREAFLNLENDGLLVRNPNKSTMVLSFSAADIENIYRLRAAIEVSCLELCMEKSFWTWISWKT